MTDLMPVATPCLGCAAPVDLPDSRGPAGGAAAEYLDPSRWCDRCLRHYDDWDRFFLLYHPRLRRFCLDRLKGLLPRHQDFRQAADDIAQETMLIAYRHFRSWDRPERAIWTTARREIYRMCEAHRIVTEDGFTITVGHVPSVVPEVLGRAVTPDPAQAVVDKIALYSALSRIPRSQQEAVLTHLAFQVPAAEAGRLLARPASTVKTQSDSGRTRLGRAAATGAFIALPGAGLAGLYEVLRHVPLEAVTNSALDALTRPHTYPVLVALAVRHGIPYLRERYRAHRRARAHSGTDATDHHDDSHERSPGRGRRHAPGR
ncbi:sigma-70 family RNA polymerase sigma factor [Streptomyces sp. NPDC093801]|uniref:RNA polymerase sigma factor n=1 Tax=Streptomyces sp. NPDC093801 TaxID=3155203 RepID=UPI00344C350B